MKCLIRRMQHWSFNFMAEILICARLRKNGLRQYFLSQFPLFLLNHPGLASAIVAKFDDSFCHWKWNGSLFQLTYQKWTKKPFQIKPRCHYLLPCNSNDNEDIRERLQKKGGPLVLALFFLRHDNHSDHTKKSDAENTIFNSYFVFYHKSLRIQNIQS